MNEFEKHISNYWTDFPDTWSFLGSPQETEQISIDHKDQIHFLNKEGTAFIKDYMYRSKMVGNFPAEPFKDYFKNITSFNITEDCDSEVKKWLHNKGIPFSEYVFIDSDRSDNAIMLTWKMVIKYWKGLFFSDDIVIFDNSLEWCLFYNHNDTLYFGSENIFDHKKEVEKTILINELINKIPK